MLGAAPSIANGLITGVDHVPPILLRAGQVMGARGWTRFRHVVLPASLPSFIGGLKQGWAFAWRSLMAGELLVILGVVGVGYLLSQYRSVSDAPALIAMMIVILVVGIVVDAVCLRHARPLGASPPWTHGGLMNTTTLPAAATFEAMHPVDVLRWAHDEFGDGLVVTCSFADAVLPHLVSRAAPGAAVVLLDTQYLFAETCGSPGSWPATST